MGEMDDLLKEIKAEFSADKKSQSKKEQETRNEDKRNFLTPLVNSSPNKVSPSSSSPSSMALASSSSPLDSLIADVKQEFESGKTPPSLKSHNYFNESQTSSPSSNSDLIKELQLEYQEQERIKQQQQQQEKQRRQEALKRKAQQWLKNLDPHTDEGLWFEEFSYSYDSKLAAAIDYLAAMES